MPRAIVDDSTVGTGSGSDASADSVSSVGDAAKDSTVNSGGDGSTDATTAVSCGDAAVLEV